MSEETCETAVSKSGNQVNGKSARKSHKKGAGIARCGLPGWEDKRVKNKALEKGYCCPRSREQHPGDVGKDRNLDRTDGARSNLKGGSELTTARRRF